MEVTKPPETLPEWLGYLASQSLPLLDSSWNVVNQLDERSGKSIDRLSEVLLLDPGAVVSLLTTVNAKNHSPLFAEVSTVENAVMMLGLTQTRSALKRLKVIRLLAQAPALQHYLQTLAKAYHTGYIAFELARIRGDLVAKESFVAGFLYFLGEMAMWLYGAERMKNVVLTQHKEHLAYEEAQIKVLGFSLESLSAGLAVSWRLPELVRETMHPELTSRPQVAGVRLAAELATSCRSGWYTQRVRDCMQKIAAHIRWEMGDTARRLHEIAVACARETELYTITPAAALLVQTDVEQLQDAKQSASSDSPAYNQPEPLSAQTILNNCIVKFGVEQLLPPDEVWKLLMDGLHNGLGLSRVVFLDANSSGQQLKPVCFSDSATQSELHRLSIDLARPSLISRLLEKTQAIWVKDSKVLNSVPVVMRGLVNSDSFYLMALLVPNSPTRLVYADRVRGVGDLSEAHYSQFKNLCKMALKSIATSAPP